MAARYKDRITILEDAEIEELYGQPRFTHEERVHYFTLTPQERAVADGHYSLASRVLFILQAGYFKAKMLFFSFEIDEVADDVKHILQQHYPQFHDARLKSAVSRQTRYAQQRKLLELYDYRACVDAERSALAKKADQVVRISAKPIFVFQALVQYLESHRVVAPGYSFLQDVVSRALGKERARLTSLLHARLDEATCKMLDKLYIERDTGYAVTPLKQDPKDFSRWEMRREMARSRLLEPLYRTARALLPHVLDGLLYHESCLVIDEHYTDTGGFSDHVFAVCRAFGFRFAPRIRNLREKRLYSMPGVKVPPELEFLVAGQVNMKLIQDHWQDILRLLMSIKTGTVTASVILRKLAAYPRQNGLAQAPREIGKLERTLFTLDWLQDPELRRRSHVGLNKGEQQNSLRRAVFFNRLGEIRDRSYENQRYRASGLNLLVVAIILWNTVYLQRAVDHLRKQGIEPGPDDLAHLSPLGWEHINLTGDYAWEADESLNPDQFRLLRTRVPELAMAA